MASCLTGVRMAPWGSENEEIAAAPSPSTRTWRVVEVELSGPTDDGECVVTVVAMVIE